MKTPEQVYDLIRSYFCEQDGEEEIPFVQAAGRILASSIAAADFVPDFDRSSVDGYAVRAEDTLGCSCSVPVILKRTGQILMGESAQGAVLPGTCFGIPTGGQIPEGADSVVMVEDTEDCGNGRIGVLRPAVPGRNMISRGADVKPGQPVLPKGRILRAKEIGILAALGIASVRVKKKVKVGIIATGDELVQPEERPRPGQVRNVHSYLLSECVREAGGEAQVYGIIRDDIRKLQNAVVTAAKECDMVIITGGTSVGIKDATFRIIRENGTVLFHGIDMRPGKSAVLGVVGRKPVWGLPGHPSAAAFVMQMFVIPLQDQLAGCIRPRRPVTAILEEPIAANHGPAQYIGMTLRDENGRTYAKPVCRKAGIILSLADSHGYLCINRGCEGTPEGTVVQIFTV